jgi:hypothetical protein
MSPSGASELRLAYKLAVDEWIIAIRAEEALATTNHSVTAMERWDEAHFREEEARERALAVRDAYKDAIRNADE